MIIAHHVALPLTTIISYLTCSQIVTYRLVKIIANFTFVNMLIACGNIVFLCINYVI